MCKAVDYLLFVKSFKINCPGHHSTFLPIYFVKFLNNVTVAFSFVPVYIESKNSQEFRDGLF